jgi:predicted MFS family arabinose efflux permease
VSTATLTSATSSVEKRERMPTWDLLALGLLGFIAILTETLPAGLLPQIGSGLSVGDAQAGQLVTAYAIGSVAAAIPGAVLTRGWQRRTVLLSAVLGFLLFNSLTALSDNYLVTLVARFMAGAAAGVTWSLVPVYARLMAPSGSEGRAMAIALVGTPLALSLGVPLGTLAGAVLGWRVPFFAMSGVALVLVGWILASVPDFPGSTDGRSRSVRRVLTIPGIGSILSVVFVWMFAHNILYTYVSPFLRFNGQEQDVAVVLLVFGAGALAGIWLIGLMVDRHLRHLVLGSLALFAVSSAVSILAGDVTAVTFGATFVWGATFGGAATLLQTASADTAGADADIAQSLIVTIWNSAIASGGVGGGLLLETLGPAAFAPSVAILAVLALVIARRASVHGFPKGRRA